MFLYGGRVADAHRAVTASDDEFVLQCARQFGAHYGHAPGASELNSWRRSWPLLLDALVRAGLGELYLFLEYELISSGERVDAMLLGVRDPDGLAAVVIELKQWSTGTPDSSVQVRVGERTYTHPCRQAAGYVGYFREWIDEPDLDLEIRGVAFLHAAPAELVESLRRAVAPQGLSSEIRLVGRDDLGPSVNPAELAQSLLADDLKSPEDVAVKQFLGARHVPPRSLFDGLGKALAGNNAFTLVGAQQEAQLHVVQAVKRCASSGGRHVILVTGGPGTGKTIIATHLLADIPTITNDKMVARYFTPSGTLRRQLIRAVGGEEQQISKLFLNVGRAGVKAAKDEVGLVDEAHRMRRNGRFMELLLRFRGPVAVFFVDDQQLVRPDEGLTAAELEVQARSLNATVQWVDLTSQFRCAGSQYYLRWLDQLLRGVPEQWNGDRYDMGVAADPDGLDAWVSARQAAGHDARITAGFCWAWSPPAGGRLADDVKLEWQADDGTTRRWERPWNANDQLEVDHQVVAPRREFWATDAGGENQVGCVYTCQGLEYDYSGVIMGRDLVRRGDRWEAHPERSEDPVMERHKVGREQYLELAINTYWVLASRGKRGCRLYSDDPETQRFLQSLFPADD